MQVLVNSDNHIEASLDFMTAIGKRVEDKIKRFEELYLPPILGDISMAAQGLIRELDLFSSEQAPR